MTNRENYEENFSKDELVDLVLSLKQRAKKAEAERDEARRESVGVKSFLRRYRYRIKGGEQMQSYIDDVLLGRNGFINKSSDDFAIEQQIKGARLFASYLDGANFSAAIAAKESGFFQLAESFAQQLRKELEK